MKNQPLLQLAPWMAAAFIALAVFPAQAQESPQPDSTEAYVGDLPARGDCGCVSTICRQYGRSDLFYNYYTQGVVNRANAQMYPSPLPTPVNVGQTFITYQPFYPHEYLYHHKNRWHNLYDNGRGLNRTKAVYYSPPIRQALSNVYWNYLRLPR